MILKSNLCLSLVIANKFINKSNIIRMAWGCVCVRVSVCAHTCVTRCELYTLAFPLQLLSVMASALCQVKDPSVLLSWFGVQGAARVHGKAMPFWITLCWVCPAGPQHLSRSAYGTCSHILFFLKPFFKHRHRYYHYIFAIIIIVAMIKECTPSFYSSDTGHNGWN